MRPEVIENNPAGTIKIQPFKLAEHIRGLNEGNVEMVGRLALSIAGLRGEYGKLFAKLRGIEIEQALARNEIEELKTEVRRLKQREETWTKNKP